MTNKDQLDSLEFYLSEEEYKKLYGEDMSKFMMDFDKISKETDEAFERLFTSYNNNNNK